MSNLCEEQANSERGVRIDLVLESVRWGDECFRSALVKKSQHLPKVIGCCFEVQSDVAFGARFLKRASRLEKGTGLKF